MDLVELAKQNTNLRHPWETTRINIVAEKIQGILQKVGKENKQVTVLDVGSGDAYVIDQLASRFKNVHFVAVDTYYTAEIMQMLREGFANKERIELYNDWELFGKEGYEIDIILLLDVIEHVPDDVQFLEEINGYVKNACNFIITVPAFQWLFTQHDTFLKHYRRYNSALLERNIRAAGWQPIETGYFYILALIMRSIGKVKELAFGSKVSDKGISEWKKSAGFTSFVNGVLWMDYKISKALGKLGIKLPGLSNYCVGERNEL